MDLCTASPEPLRHSFLQMKKSLIAAGIRLFTGVRSLAPDAAWSLPEGPVIFYANHSSHLDFLTIWAALAPEWRERTSPVAGEDYWGRSALRRWLAHRVFAATLIPREGINRANNPIDRIAAVLDSGRAVLIFPEGTRGGGETAAFRSGIHHLARRFPAVPLVAVYLENLNRILPKGTFLPVPIIARAEMRPPLFLQPDETKPAFLERARLHLVATPARASGKLNAHV